MNEPDVVARVAGLLADPARAQILLTLIDGSMRPAGELAFAANISAQSASAHLAKLEIKIWLEEMIPYLPRLELDGEPVRLRSNFFNGIKRLPVRVVS